MMRADKNLVYISVEAYGESRFTMTVNPCLTNIYSLCPLNASVPITAFALFQVGPMQVSGIPQIAYEIPDFEGYTRIQIFANSSQTEIACFQAVMRNGNSFSQVESVGPILAIFTIVAIIASFTTAAYGVSVPHMRTHYAHSLSILVIFETFQSIYFSGALSVHWPSVLPAWWSNFAWSAGLIYTSDLVHAIDKFAGISGNASQVGGAGSSVINTGGGLAQQIYGRSLEVRDIATETIEVVESAARLMKRQPYNESDPYDYNWNGDPVTPGMPTPGDWTGFAGNLSQLSIPAPDAFLLALIWLMVLLAGVSLCVIALKYSLEGLARLKWIQQDRLAYFRSHWTGYLGHALLRTLFIGFFSMMTLTLFQFAIRGPAGPTAIAAVVFAIFLVGMGGLVAYACFFRLRFGKFASSPDRILFRPGMIFKVVPCVVPVRLSQLREQESTAKPAGSLPWVHFHFIDDDPSRTSVHQDEPYIKRFGWLSARYRKSRWWFFAFWLCYQFIRACFIGGAAGNPLVQVFGLFIYDFLGLVAIAKLNPYEGQRNTALAVWILGLVKFATTGISIAFLPDFNLNRIIATVLGVIIIVIQAMLTIALMILVIIGGISSWMSLTRNREEFSSQNLDGVRIKYFEHLITKAPDDGTVEKPKKKSKKDKKLETEKMPELPQEPYFSVTSVRRAPKIEDEDADAIRELDPANTAGSTLTLSRPRHGRTNSVSSRHSVSSLPRGARTHRASWSSRDFSQWQAELDRPSTAMANRLSSHTPTGSVSKTGPVRPQKSASSLRNSIPTQSRPMTPTAEQEERLVELLDERKHGQTTSENKTENKNDSNL